MLDTTAAVNPDFPWGCVGLTTISTTPYITYLSASGGSRWQAYSGASWSPPAPFGAASQMPELRWSEYFDYLSSQVDALLFNGSGTYWAGSTASVSSVSPPAGSPGTTVTVSGLTFGATQGASTLTLNGVAASPTSWTNSQITAPVPAGATSGPIVVTVYAQASNPIMFTVEGGVAGSVTSAGNGAAIPGALVQALQSNAVLGSATTGSNGTYSIPNLFAGNYDLRFTAPGFATTLLTGNMVVSGATTTVNGSLGSPGKISGKVTQSDGVTPLPGATVTAAQGSDSLGSATTDANGSYTIATLAPGTYAVLAAAGGFATGLSTGVAVTAGNTTPANFLLTAESAPAISYFYDELGRLIGASDSQNNTAAYSYDAVGNLLTVGVNPSTKVSIIGFDPAGGPAAASVAISGTGFSATASQDAVTFNGTAATITSASTTRLTVSVPSGATSGPIGVTAPGGSATSSSSFTVPPPPTITGFSPASGTPGTSVTITGTGFSATASQDTVTFNGTAATITSATPTQIVAAVPGLATTGPIGVTSPDGSATSNSSFTVIPVTITAFSPTSGPVGTSVTITGTGFSATASQDTVTFGTKMATITSASTTQIVVTVPTGAGSGPIVVTAPGGEAISSASFTVTKH